MQPTLGSWGVWQFVKVEIELNRRNFVSPKHDWKECPWRWWSWEKSGDRG